MKKWITHVVVFWGPRTWRFAGLLMLLVLFVLFLTL
jgi:hypothetical protein